MNTKDMLRMLSRKLAYHAKEDSFHHENARLLFRSAMLHLYGERGCPQDSVIARKYAHDGLRELTLDTDAVNVESTSETDQELLAFARRELL